LIGNVQILDLNRGACAGPVLDLLPTPIHVAAGTGTKMDKTNLIAPIKVILAVAGERA